jgi:hypothetical protein
MDLNKIALSISLLALTLTVPLAIAANILTPRITKWYGTTSYKRTTKRLASLEQRFDEAKREWVFPPAEWEAYHMGVMTAMLVLFGFLVTFSAIIEAELVLRKEILRLMSVTTYAGVLAITGLGYLAIIIFFFKVTSRANDVRQMHNEKGKKDMEEEINRLKALKEDWEHDD